MIVAQERNDTLDQFIRRWLHVSLLSSAQLPSQFPRPSLEAANVSEWPRPERITRPQNIANDEFFDIQQIPWKSKMGVRREEARKLRDTWYRPYTNLDISELDVCVFLLVFLGVIFVLLTRINLNSMHTVCRIRQIIFVRTLCIRN